MIRRCSNPTCNKLCEERQLIDFDGTGAPVCMECDLKACTEALESFGVDWDQLGGEVTL